MNRRDRLWHAIGITLSVGVSLTVFSVVQYSTSSLLGTDAYYHVKLAEEMRQSNVLQWPVEFPWLPKTVLSSERYTDHHFLFHVLLIPFIELKGLLGAKAAAVGGATLAFVAFLLVAPGRTFWSRLGAGATFFCLSPGFLYRMSMVRAQSFSLAILLLLTHLLLVRKYKASAFVCVLYVWTYNAFPLALLLLAAYVVARWINERVFDLRACFSVVGGLGAGVIVNPYFPANVVFLYHHLVDKFQVGEFATRVGKEWYPYTESTLLTHAGVPLALLLVALVLTLIFKLELSIRSRALLHLALITLAMLLRSRRFIELFPVFGLLTFLSVSFDLAKARELSRFQFPKNLATIVPAIALICVVAVLGCTTITGAVEEAEESQPYNKYRTSAEWLARNTEAGELVINADWDDFPRLFHFNSHNMYLVGLDPYFLFARDQTGFRLWREATKGKLKETPGRALARHFDSKWIFVDKGHRAFVQSLKKENGVSLEFDGGDSFVFKVEPDEQYPSE